jgi:hypothetical protein
MRPVLACGEVLPLGAAACRNSSERGAYIGADVDDKGGTSRRVAPLKTSDRYTRRRNNSACK